MLDEQSVLKKIGSEIKQLRENAGLNQNDLAEKVGITRVTISNIENGKDTLVSTLIALANVLKTDLNELFSEHTIEDCYLALGCFIKEKQNKK